MLNFCRSWLTGPPENRLKGLYDCLAPLYFVVHPFVRRVAARAVRLVPDNVPLQVLDVCTGTGIVAEEMSRRGHAVTGIDVSISMLRRRSQLRRQLGIPVVQMDARVLSFQDRSLRFVLHFDGSARVRAR